MELDTVSLPCFGGEFLFCPFIHSFTMDTTYHFHHCISRLLFSHTDGVTTTDHKFCSGVHYLHLHHLEVHLGVGCSVLSVSYCTHLETISFCSTTTVSFPADSGSVLRLFWEVPAPPIPVLQFYTGCSHVVFFGRCDLLFLLPFSVLFVLVFCIFTFSG